MELEEMKRVLIQLADDINSKTYAANKTGSEYARGACDEADCRRKVRRSLEHRNNCTS